MNSVTEKGTFHAICTKKIEKQKTTETLFYPLELGQFHQNCVKSKHHSILRVFIVILFKLSYNEKYVAII